MAGDTGAVRSIFSAIELIDRVTGPITTINRKIDDLRDHLGGQQTLIDKQTAAWSFFNNQMYGTPLIVSRVQQQINDLTGYLQQNAAVLGLIGGEIAAISYATKNFMVSSAVDASKEMAMMQALQKSYGDGAEEYVDKLKKLSGGVYDDGQILSLVNRAHAMGVAYENVGAIIQGARGIARDTGESSDQSFEDIMTGISTGNMRSLRSANIKIDETKAMREYATAARAALAADSEDGIITEQQVKSRALELAVVEQLNERYGDMNTEQRTLSESLAAMHTSWNQLGQSLSKGLIPILDKLASVVSTVCDFVNMIPQPVLTVVGILVTLAAIIGIVSGLILVQHGLVVLLGGEYGTLSGVIGLVNTSFVKMIGVLTAMVAPESFTIVATQGLTASLWQLVAASAAFLAEWWWLIAAVLAFAAAVYYLQDAMNNGWENSKLEKHLQKIKDLMDAIWDNPLGKAIFLATAPTNPLAQAYVGDKVATGITQAADVATKSPEFSKRVAGTGANVTIISQTTIPNLTTTANLQDVKALLDKSNDTHTQQIFGKMDRDLRSVGV
ncbi:MAG: hypothetical protein LUQ71_10245 [Methanoregula sp.]|nr:hypothetical protein [Methanoregula sp.]